MNAVKKIGLAFTSITIQVDKEIQLLKECSPNSDEAKERQEAELDFLTNLRTYVSKVAGNAQGAHRDPETAAAHIAELNRKLEDIDSLLSRWWEENKEDAVEWCIRFPAIGFVIAALSLCGAHSGIVTGAAFASIGRKLFSKGQKITIGDS
ncbi:MAG: hypothetical protein AAGD92_14100 [Pseudomonadota bacterium]